MLSIFRRVDWVLMLSVLTLVFLGLITVKSFGSALSAGGLAGADYFFNRQILWVFLGILVFSFALFVDWNFLKTNSIFLLILYGAMVALLALIFVGGSRIRGAVSWYQIYSAQIEPVELMKPVLVLLLAKYFSRRHVEIGRITHIFISGTYAAIPAVLVALQPDFGSAAILVLLWLGIALIAGIRLRHLLFLGILGAVALVLLWNFALLPYQKDRVIAFLDPQSYSLGTGYHTLQSIIAVGSGQIFGKGIGGGTQSRLEFLPESETDFIFAAFAEEWGFLGVTILFFFFGTVIWRVLRIGIYADSNFEKLYAAGFAFLLFFQALIHVGMNVGVFPVTGLGMPFLSYGGSSLISLFLGLGILMSFHVRKKSTYLGYEERFEEGIVGA